MILPVLMRIIGDTAANVTCPTGYVGSCDTGLPKIGASPDELKTILQLTFGIVSAIAVLIIVIGGFRFVLSEGNPENAAKARETIIYALVGLAIALSAEAIVSFVLNRA